jgi:hypothetical protein
MAKYRVIAASCHGKNGKVWEYGEVVEGSEFVGSKWEDGRPEQLVKEGFLVRVEGEEKKAKSDVKSDKPKNRRGPKPKKKIETASEALETAGGGV